MYRKISSKESNKVYIKTFDGFDLYYKGKAIYFSNSKAKELLAILVDHGGKEVSLAQLAHFLSDKEDAAAKQSVHMAWHRLKKTLESCGIEGIVKKGRGMYSINCDMVECDSWDMMEKSQDRYFMGEYMPEYSWAEVTLSYLIQKFDEIEAQKTGGVYETMERYFYRSIIRRFRETMLRWICCGLIIE